MWGLIVSVPDHCLSFYFSFGEEKIRSVGCQYASISRALEKI